MPPLKTERERKQWAHFRWRHDCHDACHATREAILEGDWIGAISWAMQAGNRLLRDRAATGRARGAALARPKMRSAHAAQLEKRNGVIIREALDLKRRNGALTDNNIAMRLAGKVTEGVTLPSAEAIRKIIRAARKMGGFDVSSQD